MKQLILTLPLAALVLLTGCGKQTETKTELTAAERTQLYRTAIEGARDQELNDAVGVVTSASEDQGQAVFDALGLKAEQVEACALSVSMMNVKAYGIAAIYPAEGWEEAVRNSLNDFIVRQKENFQQYLPDQYEIASKARLETLKDGTILLVMCEDQDRVFEDIRTAVEAG